MRTKSIKPNKINIVTLGCSKNLVDSEVLLSQLKGNDMAATHESEKNDANIIVVNTCGFIDNAKQELTNSMLPVAYHTATKTSLKMKFLRWMPTLERLNCPTF